MNIKKIYSLFCGGQDLAAFHIAVARTIILQGGLLVISTAVSIFISRALGVEARGTTSWIASFANGGSICVALGMGAASKKYIAKYPDQLPVFVFLNLALLVISLIFFLPILYHYGVSSPVPKREHVAFLMGLFLIPCIAISSVANEMIIGMGRMLHSNILLIAEKGTNISLSILLLTLGCISPLTVIIIYITAYISRIVLSVYYLRPYVHKIPAYTEILGALFIARKLLVSAYVSGIATYYTGSFLTIMLGIFSSAKDLGYFVVAKLIIDNVLTLVSSLHSFAIPQLSKQSTPENYRKTKLHIIMLMSVVMLATSLPLYLYSNKIIYLLFGDSFREGGECLHIIILGLVANGLVTAANAVIASQSKEYLFMLAPIVTAVCMTILVWVFRETLDSTTSAYIYDISFMVGLAVVAIPVMYAKLNILPNTA